MRKIISLIIAVMLLIPGSIAIANYNPLVAGEIEGYLINITITPETEATEEAEGTPQVVIARIETYGGQFYELEIDERANLMIDRRLVNLHDFKSGMEVYGKLQGRKLTSIEAYSTSVMGHTEPGSLVRTGIITNMEANQLQVKLSNGDIKTYSINPATLVLKQGQQITPDILYTGDKVRIFFDDINVSMVNRVEVEGNSILINNIFKGDLSSIDNTRSMINIDNIETFRNGSFEKQGTALKIPYSRDLLAYVGTQKLPITNLKYYKGKTVYVATKSIMGKEVIERIIVKNQYESGFSGKIQDVNWYATAIEMGNRNFNFYDGSIIVKDGRLQESTILSNNSDVYVLADGLGTNRIANLIYIYNISINNSSLGQNNFYVGRLDQIAQDFLWLDDFFLLSDNNWEAFSEPKELFYDNDTFIYNSEDKKQITNLEFWAGDYTVDEDNTRDSSLKDWYAYVYTDGDRVVSIKLQKSMDSLLGQRITTGRVEQVIDDSMVGWTLKLRDANDFSQAKNQWMPKTSSLSLSIDDAMIIKYGQLITPGELRNGDMLYLVRDDFKTKIVLVK